jgi:hypothetical protein
MRVPKWSAAAWLPWTTSESAGPLARYPRLPMHGAAGGDDRVGGRTLPTVHRQRHGSLAADDRFARLDVAELTIELATEE